MKKSELIFAALLIPVDIVMIISAAVLAYFVRFTGRVVEIRPILFDISFRQYLLLVAIVIPFLLIIFAIIGLYNIRHRRLIDDLTGAFIGVSTGVIGIVIYIFLRAELFSSRFLLIVSWFFAIILIVFGRIIVNYIKIRMYRLGYGVHRVVLLGNTNSAQSLIKNYQGKSSGHIIVAMIEQVGEGTLSELEKISQEKGVDEIIQIDPSVPKEQMLDIIDFADERKIDIKFIPDMFSTQATNIDVRTVAGIPIVELRRTPLDGWGKIIKRAIDIFGSLFGIIVLSPLFLLVALLIKIDSKGPVFVGLTRVGRDKNFQIFKFRSMVVNAHAMKKELLDKSEREGPLFKMKDDPRITKVGKFLRKSRIDELPQLFNVLKDEMSLIGPRPHEPEEVAQYKKHQRKVLAIKPGMTGMPQVSGASDLTFDDEVKLDTFYIENWSLKIDLQILLKTVRIVLTAEGAA